MTDASESRTRVSLLERIRQHPEDEAAWHEFVSDTAPKSGPGAGAGSCRKPMPAGSLDLLWFIRDSKTLVTRGKDGRYRAWDIGTG